MGKPVEIRFVNVGTDVVLIVGDKRYVTNWAGAGAWKRDLDIALSFVEGIYRSGIQEMLKKQEEERQRKESRR